MVKVLKGGAYGPDGDYVGPGEKPPSSWPKEFLADLDEHGQLVDEADVAGDVAKRAELRGEPVAAEGTTSRGRKGRS